MTLSGLKPQGMPEAPLPAAQGPLAQPTWRVSLFSQLLSPEPGTAPVLSQARRQTQIH